MESQSIVTSLQDSPVKRGRGRPAGAKNLKASDVLTMTNDKLSSKMRTLKRAAIAMQHADIVDAHRLQSTSHLIYVASVPTWVRQTSSYHGVRAADVGAPITTGTPVNVDMGAGFDWTLSQLVMTCSNGVTRRRRYDGAYVVRLNPGRATSERSFVALNTIDTVAGDSFPATLA